MNGRTNKQTNKQKTRVCGWKDERKNIFNCIDGLVIFW